MRIGGVDFPEPLLNALRERQLVVFAGAGVSMGPPANMPGFRELARQVAEGTGLFIGEDEPEDRFLGRVKEAGPCRFPRSLTQGFTRSLTHPENAVIV
jgi:hypothetical protein